MKTPLQGLTILLLTALFGGRLGETLGEGYIAAPADEKRRGGKGGRMFLPCLPFPSWVGQLLAEAGGKQRKELCTGSAVSSGLEPERHSGKS